MSKKILLIGLILAGIFGSLLLFLFQHDSRTVTSEYLGGPQLRSLSEESDSDGIPKETDKSGRASNELERARRAIAIPSSVEEPINAVRSVWGAKNADDFYHALTALKGVDPELAAQKLADLDGFCSEAIKTMDTEALGKKRSEFCDGYLGPETIERKSMDELLSDVSASASLRLQEEIVFELDDAKRKGVASDVFTRLVVNSMFPEQIGVLMAQNTQSVLHDRMYLWRLGGDMLERYPTANLLNAQTAALTLYQCVKFGGCGSSNYFTVIYCQNNLSGRCLESATVEEMIYQTTPPADFNLANEILSDLLRRHRTGS